MSEFVEDKKDKKETSVEREEKLLAGPVGQTPQGVTRAMGISLMKGKDLFADSDEAKKLRDAHGVMAANVEKIKNLNPMTPEEAALVTDEEKIETGKFVSEALGGKEQGGGVLEFFGLAGGRRRRRKKSRKRKRKSKKKKGGKSRKKRRKSKRKKSRRKRKKSRRRRRRK